MQLNVPDLINFVYLLFNALRNGIKTILGATIVKASPMVAGKYADALSILVTATAVWLMLEFSTGLKKVVRTIVILGWILLAASIGLEVLR